MKEAIIFYLGVFGKPVLVNGEVTRYLLDSKSFPSLKEAEIFLNESGMSFYKTCQKCPFISSLIPTLMVVIYEIKDSKMIGRPVLKLAREKFDAMDN
jgi:hypothetical protein